MAEEGGTLSMDVGDEEEDLDKLETEVEQMAAELLEARATLPGLLTSTLSTLLAARRPNDTVSDTGPSDPAAQGGRVWEREMEEKARLVKEKMERNAAEMRVVLERLRECVARTEKLRSFSSSSSSSSSACNGINSIHPAFNKRKIF